MQPEGFRQLLSQAQAGDREAMDRLFELIRPHLQDVARAYADSDRPDGKHFGTTMQHRRNA